MKKTKIPTLIMIEMWHPKAFIPFSCYSNHLSIPTEMSHCIHPTPKAVIVKKGSPVSMAEMLFICTRWLLSEIPVPKLSPVDHFTKNILRKCRRRSDQYLAVTNSNSTDIPHHTWLQKLKQKNSRKSWRTPCYVHHSFVYYCTIVVLEYQIFRPFIFENSYFFYHLRPF